MKATRCSESNEFKCNPRVCLNIKDVLKHLKKRKAFDLESYLKLESNLKEFEHNRQMAMKPNCKLLSMQSTQFLKLSVKVIQSLNILRNCNWKVTDLFIDESCLKDSKDYYCTSFKENALRQSCDSVGAYEEPYSFYVEMKNILYKSKTEAKKDAMLQDKIKFINSHILCPFENSLQYYGLLKGCEMQSLIRRMVGHEAVDLNILYNCKKKMFNHAGLQVYLVRKMTQALQVKDKQSKKEAMFFSNCNPKVDM
jgi:hypothetical protein